MPKMADQFGVEDNVGVVLRGPDGEIKHAEGVKGPDPEVWGDDSERPDPFVAGGEVGLALNEVTDDGVKGPSSEQWETNEKGEYVNR